jgi:hypothetical protein
VIAATVAWSAGVAAGWGELVVVEEAGAVVEAAVVGAAVLVGGAVVGAPTVSGALDEDDESSPEHAPASIASTPTTAHFRARARP